MKAESYETRVSARILVPEGAVLRKQHGYPVGEEVRHNIMVPGLGKVDRLFTTYSQVFIGPSPVYDGKTHECTGYRVGIYASTPRRPAFYALQGFWDETVVPYHEWQTYVTEFKMSEDLGQPVGKDN